MPSKKELPSKAIQSPPSTVDRSGPITRKERERNRHKEEILTAAEGLFAEKGYHGCTVEDVAEQAEFSVGTIYNFFSNKEALYVYLIEERCRQLSEHINHSMDLAGGPLEAIRAFVKSKIELTQKYESFARLYTRERMGDRFKNNRLWRDTVEPLYEQIWGRLTATFETGTKEGIFRDDLDPFDMTVALDGLTDGFMFEWLTTSQEDKDDYNHKYETMVKLFLEGVGQK